MLQTISITVSGKVQGVYYRQSTKEKALELGVQGVVKNLPNGHVHVVATGTMEQLHALVTWCMKGPTMARVDGIDVKEEPLLEFFGFSVQR